MVGRDLANKSISQAIQDAASGDTIYVKYAHIKEKNIIVDKSLTLIGIDYPIIDGENKYEVVSLTGHNISIIGFEIQNSGKSGMNDIAGIRCIDSKNIHILNNRIINSHFGIHVSNSEDIVIQNNKVEGTPGEEQNTGNGIHLWKCNHARILNNHLSGHRDGIYFEFVTNSTIQDNISTENIRYGLHFMFSHHNLYLCNEFIQNGAGVAVMYSREVSMEENLFYRNWGASSYGLLLKDISDSRIIHNEFVENTTGIHFEGSNRMLMEHNNFISNGWAMKVQANCLDNSFFRNNFSLNTFDIGTNGSISLNTFEYNYWDKYDGYDLNKDGIGDVPYYPVSLYCVVVEQNPNCMILLRSILIGFLDRAEKAIPSLTPANLSDKFPSLSKW